MKNSLITPVILLLVCCTNCKNPDKATDISSKEIVFENSGTWKNIETEYYGQKNLLKNPGQLALLGDKIIISEPQCDTLFKLISIYDPSMHYSLGTKGRGPGEFLSPTLRRSRLQEDSDSTFQLFDPFKKILYRFQWKDAYYTGKPEITSRVYAPASMQIVTNLIQVGDSSFIGTSTGIQNVFFSWDLKNDSAVLCGESDFVKPPGNFPETFIPYLFTSSLTTNKENGRTALAYYLYDILDIYDNQGELIRRIKGSANIDFPEIKAGSGSFSSDKATLYYDDIYSTDNYIYSLYYGFTESSLEDPEKRNELYSKVIVYSWEGDIVDRYKIDGIVTSICVAGDSLLYGLRPLDYMNPLFKAQIQLISR